MEERERRGRIKKKINCRINLLLLTRNKVQPIMCVCVCVGGGIFKKELTVV